MTHKTRRAYQLLSELVRMLMVERVAIAIQIDRVQDGRAWAPHLSEVRDRANARIDRIVDEWAGR